MKILVDPVGDIGGAEILMKDITKILKNIRRYYNLEIICALHCNMCEHIEACDYTIDMSSVLRLARKIRLYDNIVFLKTANLREVLDTVDLVLTHQFFVPALLNKKTHVLAIAGRDWGKFYSNQGLFYKLHMLLPYYIRIKFLKRANRILVFNPSSAQWFRTNFGEDKVKLIRTGIFVKDYPKQFTKPTYDFAFVGRFSPEKNPKIIIDTFLGTGFRGIMIGAPEGNVIGNIKIEPFQPREFVIEKIAKSRVGIIPSRFEAFPLILLEYLVMGIPVIKSDSFSTPLDEYTLEFRCCDSTNLKEAFEEVIENYAYYKRLSGKARRIILKHYNLEENFKEAFAGFIDASSYQGF